MNTIKTKPLCASTSNLAKVFTMKRLTLLIFKVKGQGHMQMFGWAGMLRCVALVFIGSNFHRMILNSVPLFICMATDWCAPLS